MTLKKLSLGASLGALLLSMAGGVQAGEFDWLEELNIQAKADLSDFRTELEARFDIDSGRIGAVLSSVEKPADAYMVLRLGEMSPRPMEDVVRTYRSRKHMGWGELAKSLGIKPGSREFHALKNGRALRRTGLRERRERRDRERFEERKPGRGGPPGEGRGPGRGGPPGEARFHGRGR
jgi:hypothetical protein